MDICAPAGVKKLRRLLASGLTAFCLGTATALAQTPPDIVEPMIGTPGKDVVYVPQPAEVVESILDLGKVTARDFVIDLGSGDGRNVIAAARRGARALGVEFNPEFVEYSRRSAAAAGVADRASFVQGDMYEADISQATVFALFLLTENLNKLRDKFLALRPGTRIVSNTFKISDWQPDETVRAGEPCNLWCELHLYVVPAQIAGSWRLAQGDLSLEQKYQMVSGALTLDGKKLPVQNGRVRGDTLSFSAGGMKYVGRVKGSSMEGSVTGPSGEARDKGKAIARAAGSNRRWIANRVGA